MNIEKQIEEMAKVLRDPCNGECVINKNGRIDCEACAARYLHNAGYRKQSEVVRCKDCEHFYQDGNIKICRHWNCHSTEEDAYCSYAKMKGEK